MNRESDAEALGKAVVARRAELEMSRPDLARGSTLSYPYIYEIERGRKFPSTEALELIASTMELTPTALIERSKDYASLTLESDSLSSTIEGAALAPSHLDELTERVMEAVRPVVRAAIAEALGDR